MDKALSKWPDPSADPAWSRRGDYSLPGPFQPVLSCDPPVRRTVRSPVQNCVKYSNFSSKEMRCFE